MRRLGSIRLYNTVMVVTLALSLGTVISSGANAVANWLYQQRGAGFIVKDVGLVVYDFEGNEVVLAQAAKLANLKGRHEQLPQSSFLPSSRFLVKYSPLPAGRLIFARQVTSDKGPFFESLKADRTGAIYAASSFGGTAQLIDAERVLSFTEHGRGDCLLVKWNSNGTLAWARQFGGTGLESAENLAIDPADNLFVSGEFQGTLEFTGEGRNYSFRSGTNNYETYLAKFRPDGRCAWARHLTGSESMLPTSLQTDRDGNCLITGGFESRLDFAGSSTSCTLYGLGGWDLFLAKYNPDGELLWAHSGGGPNNDYATSLVVDAYGWSYIHGRFGRGAVFGQGNNTVHLECFGDADIMVAGYDDRGHFVGALRTGGSGATIDPHWTTVFDEAGNRYIVMGAKDSVRQWVKTAGKTPENSSVTTSIGDATMPSGEKGPSSGCFKSISRQADGSIQIILPVGGPPLCLIEASVDLEKWTAISTNVVREGKVFIEDGQAPQFPVRFYRVRQFVPEP